MTTAMDIDELLETAARERDEQLRRKGSDERSPRKDERGDRHDRDRTGRDRERDDERGDRHRESKSDRHSSRDRRRRDGSRARSSIKDADTDTEGPTHRREGRDTKYRDHRDRSRDRYRGSRRDDRRSGGDYYSGSGRARSRSPRRPREEGRDRYRSDRGDRSRERRRRDDAAPRSAGRRTATPEKPDQDDRDKRTVFVQQISQRAETRHLLAFFEAVGEVVEAQIVKDRVTGRSKGVGYVEFKEVDSVKKAIELTGQKLKGVPIIVQHTEAEKNRASRQTDATANVANGAPFHRLYVGNIHFSVTEEDLKAVFEPYGELEEVLLQKEPENGGRSKGYGFVQFREPKAAKAALEMMNGFELANRPIRVGLGNDKFTPESTANLLRNFNSQATSFQGSAFSGAGGRGAYAGGSGGVFDRTHGRDDRGVTGASALDDTDVAGININNMNRDRLMNLLARNPVEEPANNRVNGQAAVAARAPTTYTRAPSRCIKIQNAFDPESEFKQFGPGWIKQLEDEVKAECDVKYGKVVHIAVDPNTDGDIYVKFADVSGGEKALHGLNGRNFNFRTIRAESVIDKIYDSLYAAAATK